MVLPDGLVGCAAPHPSPNLNHNPPFTLRHPTPYLPAVLAHVVVPEGVVGYEPPVHYEL